MKPGRIMPILFGCVVAASLPAHAQPQPNAQWRVTETTLFDLIQNGYGGRPEDVDYSGTAEPLQKVWIGVRAALRSVVEQVTLADLASGKLPKGVESLVKDPEAWLTRR